MEDIEMKKWFNKQARLVKFILLLIPVVNWIVELLLRWEKALKTKNVIDIIIAVLVLVFGLVFGWLDLIWVLIFGKLFLY